MLELAHRSDRSGVRGRLDAATLVPLFIAAAYLAFEIILFGYHEPWRDEAQAWLKAKELVTPLEFLVISSEGHPPGWFWLMRLLSSFLSFDQARMLMLGVTALNAWLLARLFGDRPLLLLTLFLSLAVLHSWGFHLRPYPLILTCVVSALLLDRANRPLAATWILAASCSLSFLSGWIFGFWLLVQLHRRAPVSTLIAPALLAAAFGLSAMLSSVGNHDSGVELTFFVENFLNGLALPFAIPSVHSAAIVLVTMSLIAFGLRRTPFILGCTLALLLLLALFGSVFYGLSEWHAAFGVMLVVMAFTLSKAAVLPLILLLMTQDFWGIRRAAFEINNPVASDGLAYEAIVQDAGSRLDPPRNLVSWPDYLLTPTAARYDFRFISGNNSAVVGAIDWSVRKHLDLDRQMLASLPGPYWLVCAECQHPLRSVIAAGRTATQLLAPSQNMNDPVAAYRID